MPIGFHFHQASLMGLGVFLTPWCSFLKKIKCVPFDFRSRALTPAAVLMQRAVSLALSTGSFSCLKRCLGVSHLRYCSALLLGGCCSSTWTLAEKVLPIRPGWGQAHAAHQPLGDNSQCFGWKREAWCEACCCFLSREGEKELWSLLTPAPHPSDTGAAYESLGPTL